MPKLLVMRSAFLFVVLFFALCSVALSQVGNSRVLDDGYLVGGRVEGTDTVPHILLREVVVMPPMRFNSDREYARYSRLVRNIKITLPYARMAARKLNEINAHLHTLKTEKEKRAYLKNAEKELFGEFEKPLKKLSVSQGRLLIKLIDRETGNTSFYLIQQYKGKVSAFFWQSLARLFGSNLKDEFDAEGDDYTINYIIALIDNGLL